MRVRRKQRTYDRRKISLYFDMETVEQMYFEAERLETSVSKLVLLAWQNSYEFIKGIKHRPELVIGEEDKD